MKNHIRLCEHCIAAIRSRGEKVYELESLESSELYEAYDEETQGFLTCEWCGEELPKDSLYDCVFHLPA